MDTIKITLGKLSTDFLDSLSITHENLIFKIGTFAFIVAAFTILFYYLRKTSIISNALQDTYNDMIYKNMMLNKGGKKLLKKDGFWEKLILSILVDTFISKISLPMQPVPEIGSISVA